MAIKPHRNCTLDEYYPYDDKNLPRTFEHTRHTEAIGGIQVIAEPWRMKERMKTVSVALAVCLNFGVDPPDIIKTQPCARMECWIDPLFMNPKKAVQTVGLNLQRQYEKWQSRARYKQALDPTVDDIKKLCISLRKSAKDERVLFHYNGHGVPKPTVNGEIWLFNKAYTQYIPLSIYDLQLWMNTPSIYVYDCSNAGVIVDYFTQFAAQHEREYEEKASQDARLSESILTFKNCIQLAACAADEILPMNPALPADLFTSCLTTPIKIGLYWYVKQRASKLYPHITLEMIDRIPGQSNDRRTMLGEIHWIFTAITDTIAWNVLSKDLFQTLFRQDLLVASLFRNFLLAERVMRSYNCTPVSCPKLPPMMDHPMWEAWDLALDQCLYQLPAVLQCEDAYCHSPFFEQQLTAFEVWLQVATERSEPPEQLPIVLQVLLSQVHRLRALDLLKQFLELGPLAVNHALNVGIYPYMLKLLQSSARELRDFLVSIWAKILAVDVSCQVDLVRDGCYKYFLQMMQDVTETVSRIYYSDGDVRYMPKCRPPDLEKGTFLWVDHRNTATFVMAMIVKDYLPGQEVALQKNLISLCLELMNDRRLRLWIIICLAKLWERYDKARWCGVRDSAHEKLYVHLEDRRPEIRAAAVHALGTFLNSDSETRTEHATNVEQKLATMLMNAVVYDMSPLVRKELVNAFQWVIMTYENSFVSTINQQTTRRTNLPPGSPGTVSYRSFYSKFWDCLCTLELDPHPEVASMARTLLDHVRHKVIEWPRPSRENVIQGPSSLGSLYSIRQSPQDRERMVGRNASSHSLPPSPSTRSYFLTDSPPTNASSSVDQSELTSRMRSRLQTSETVPDVISESSDPCDEKMLISTQFVEWCSKKFVERRFKYCDTECKAHFERKWRYARNQIHSREAQDECRRARLFRVENQLFSTKCSKVPSTVRFHPYETHLVVSMGETFCVWDYGKHARLSQWNTGRDLLNRRKIPRITDLQFINAQDTTMLLTGCEDGNIRIWSNYSNSVPNCQPTLTTAWQALPEVAERRTRGTSQNDEAKGLRVVWDQQTQTVFCGGSARVIRVWDAESELKLVDVPAGTDSSVNCLAIDHDGGANVFAAGCCDGSIRIFDRRERTNSCNTITYREHTACILAASIRNDSGALMAGCQDGVIKKFDLRTKSSTVTCHTGYRMSAFDVHRDAEIFACGGVNQLTAYDLNGTRLQPPRNNDWFMSPRIASKVTHISFHPSRVVMGYSLMDNSIVVSALDATKWTTNFQI